MDKQELKKIIELLLYMTDRPLKDKDFKDIMGKEYPEEGIAGIIDEISEDYRKRESAIQVLEMAGGYQTATRADYAPWIRKLYKEKTTFRLSASALETLSIIAYKQPISRSEIEEIRGVEVTGVLETLLERRMIKISGRRETVGRPLLYSTTIDFMRHFGIKSLSELPKLEELPQVEAEMQEASQTEDSDSEEPRKSGPNPTESR